MFTVFMAYSIRMCKRRSLQILRVSILTILLLVMIIKGRDFFKDIPHDRFILNNSSMGASSVCVLPKHDPFDSSIIQYFYEIKMPCDRFPDMVSLDSQLQIQTNITAVREAGWRHLACTREIIQRVNEETIVFTSPDKQSIVPSDCSKISCRDEKSSLVYQQLMFHTDSERVLKSKTIKEETPDSPSVMIFGIDSVSQLTAKRLLPKTLKYLDRSLGAHLFQGYTKVAENTFPNLVSLLSGQKEKPEALFHGKYLDDLIPFIWRNFSDKGYVTMYAEEQPISPVFGTVSNGFNIPPTDHYFMPCALAMDNTDTFIRSPKYQYSSKFYNKILKLTPFRFCHGNKARHEIHINYLKSFLSSYKNKRKFSLTWVAALAHDDLNYLGLADDQFRDFFEWSNNNGHLNNTILIFLGDHGSNLNEIRNTVIGRVEERMPIFVVALPPYLKTKYPDVEKTLRHNSQMLTSHFDTYFTMVDILRGTFSMSSATKSEQVGRSLFGEIPAARTCEDAGIRQEYCPCHKYTPANVPRHKLIKFGEKIVEQINSKFNPEYPQCKLLSLHNVENAQKIESNFIPFEESKQFTWYSLWHSKSTHIASKQYRMMISTIPGLAKFESSLTEHSDGRIVVWDHISRRNRYGNQSHCVQESEVKPYCYCRNPAPS